MQGIEMSQAWEIYGLEVDTSLLELGLSSTWLRTWYASKGCPSNTVTPSWPSFSFVKSVRKYIVTLSWHVFGVKSELYRPSRQQLRYLTNLTVCIFRVAGFSASSETYPAIKVIVPAAWERGTPMKLYDYLFFQLTIIWNLKAFFCSFAFQSITSSIKSIFLPEVQYYLRYIALLLSSYGAVRKMMSWKTVVIFHNGFASFFFELCFCEAKSIVSDRICLTCCTITKVTSSKV